MITKMYEIKANKETKELELITLDFNCHASLINDGKKIFIERFAREYARAEYFKYYVKYKNDTATAEDVAKINLLEKAFEFSPNSSAVTDLLGLPSELVGLMYLTLYAHGAIIAGLDSKKDDNGNDVYRIKRDKISFGMDTFYNKCKSTIAQVKSGAIDIESAITTLKPLYNECTTLINHDAHENICKSWTESTKEKNTRLFIAGLLPTYKITRNNRIDEKSPLKSLYDFERYTIMWLVTGGAMVAKKSTASNTIMANSVIANIIRKNEK